MICSTALLHIPQDGYRIIIFLEEIQTWKKDRSEERTHAKFSNYNYYKCGRKKWQSIQLPRADGNNYLYCS